MQGWVRGVRGEVVGCCCWLFVGGGLCITDYGTGYTRVIDVVVMENGTHFFFSQVFIYLQKKLFYYYYYYQHT